MQILAIERYVKDEYAKEYERYYKLNNPNIKKLYRAGLISAFWSRGDKPGMVLMLDVESKDVAKEILSGFELVKNKIINYSLLPLEPYQLEIFAPDVAKKDERIFTLVYISAEVGEFETKSILSDKEHYQKRNNKIGITGVMLYEKGSFFQVLEGNEKKVNATFKRIQQDSRHKNIVKISTYYKDKREFGEYSFGYASIGCKDIEEIDGFENFFRNNNFLNIRDRQLKALLSAFRSGKWRQK